MSIKHWLVIVSVLYVVLTVALFTVPRFAAREIADGLVAIRVGTDWIFLFGPLALLAGVVALVITVWAWKRLTVPWRVLGVTPAVLSAVGVITISILVAADSGTDESPAEPPGENELRLKSDNIEVGSCPGCSRYIPTIACRLTVPFAEPNVVMEMTMHNETLHPSREVGASSNGQSLVATG